MQKVWIATQAGGAKDPTEEETAGKQRWQIRKEAPGDREGGGGGRGGPFREA